VKARMHVKLFMCRIFLVSRKLKAMLRERERERERERLLLGVTLIHTVAKGRISSSPTANDKNLEKVLENVIICIKPIGKHKFSDTDVELTELLYYCTYSENSLSLVKINGAN